MMLLVEGWRPEDLDGEVVARAEESDEVWSLLYGTLNGSTRHTACVFGTERYGLGDWWMWARVLPGTFSTAQLRAGVRQWEALLERLEGRMFANCYEPFEARFLQWLGFQQYLITLSGTRFFVREK